MAQSEKQNSSTETPTKEVDMENGKDTYGLWMVVEKRSQCFSSKQIFEEENLRRIFRGSRFSTLIFLDKNEEISANGGEKSKDFRSKGKELIVNSDLGVLINDSKVVGGISREFGSKVAQMGYVKMVGLSGPMVSGSLVDGSRDPGWTRAFSSKGPSKVIVFESRPNQIVKPTKILNGANSDFVISCSDSQAFNLEAQAVLKQNELDFINEFSLYAYNVDSLAAGNSCLIVEINSNTTCHFKSTFEGLMEVGTSLSEGVLDPGVVLECQVGKEEELVRKSKSIRGCASVKFRQIFHEYNMEYKPIIVGLLEPRVSGAKVDRIIAKLGFQRSHHVKAIGYSRGIWI
ncbi:hypothetical protein Goarm_021411, partial [Gossypium armourianum]|nr:hypothetical protein [Gossypium armourianum]